MLIQRHVINIDALFIEYAQHYFAKTEPKAWEVIVQIEAKLNEKNIPRNMIGREKRVVALEQYLSQVRNYDPVLDGLRSAVATTRRISTRSSRRCCRCWRSSPAGRSPSFWPRIIPTWPTRARSSIGCGHPKARSRLCGSGRAIRRRGRRSGRQLDVQRSRVGRRAHLQARDRRRPAGRVGRACVPINVHADEFNELMGDEFIPLINRAAAVPACKSRRTRRRSPDIEARIGNRAKAGQVIGNFNNLFMLRVRGDGHGRTADEAVAEGRGLYHHHRLRRDRQLGHPWATDFTSNTQDRISMSSVPMIEPSHVVGLPKGQCFALLQGGQLWKVRMPLPAPDPDEVMPRTCSNWPGYMRQSYSEATQWWEFTSSPALQDAALPDDLLDDAAQAEPRGGHWRRRWTGQRGRRHEGCRLDRAAGAEPTPRA